MSEEHPSYLRIAIRRNSADSFTISLGDCAEGTELTMSEVLGLRSDLSRAVAEIDDVIKLNPCPRCGCAVRVRPALSLFGYALRTAEVVCPSCSMRVRSKYTEYDEVVRWWNYEK